MNYKIDMYNNQINARKTKFTGIQKKKKRNKKIFLSLYVFVIIPLYKWF